MKEQMEPMKEKKMRTMFYQNLDLKEYVKKGTLFSARKTWEVRSHMLDVAGNFPAHKKIRELKLDVPGMRGSGQGRPRAPDPVRRI